MQKLPLKIYIFVIYNPGKKVGTHDAIYYNYPMLTTAVENSAWHCLIESRGVLAFTIILPSPHQINVGGSGKASDNMTRIDVASGERGFFFLLNQTKCPNHFSRIVDWMIWSTVFFSFISLRINFISLILTADKHITVDIWSISEDDHMCHNSYTSIREQILKICGVYWKCLQHYAYCVRSTSLTD